MVFYEEGVDVPVPGSAILKKKEEEYRVMFGSMKFTDVTVFHSKKQLLE
jgi:hypothetical protein